MAGAALGSGPDAGTRLCRSDNGLGFCGMTKKKERIEGVGAGRKQEKEMKRSRRIIRRKTQTN